MRETRFIVRVFDDRRAMGEAAARDAARKVNALLETQPMVNMIFAAAPSQNEFLESFARDKTVDFTRVRAFHMDEYVGLSPDAPQGFGNFLRARLFDLVPFAEVHYLTGDADAYAALLDKYPVDIVIMGIGENGHIAFNDPHEADFRDPLWVKRVSLDEKCRMQQVHDGCFAALELVPEYALTLTLPALTRAKTHICVVPAATKAEAVRNTVLGPVGTSCPATALRLCPDATLYLDPDSAKLLTI